MAYTLDFDIKTTGLSDVQKIEAILASIGKQAGVSASQLSILESVLRADASAGVPLNKSLQDIARSSSSMGKSVSDAAKGLLDQATAARKAQDELQRLGRMQEQAAADDARRTAQAQANAQRLGRIMERAHAENAKRAAEAQKNSLPGQIQSQVANATKGFALGALGLGAIGGVGLQLGRQLADGLVSGLKAITTEFAEASRETQLFAERMGLGVVQARQLENVAALAGVNIGTLTAASRILSNALEDSNGSGKKASAALHELGIATRTLGGDTREEGAVLTDLIDKLSKVSDPTERARLAFVALGRGAKEILPLIDELDELKGRLSTLGISYDEDIIKKGGEAQKAFNELGLTIKYLRDEIGAGIVVPITWAIKNLGGVKNIEGGISAGLGEFLPGLGPLLDFGAARNQRNADIAHVTSQASDFAGGILKSRDPSQQPDVSGATAYQQKMDATEDGMRARISDLEADLRRQQGIATDTSVGAAAHSSARSGAASDQAQIDALQRRIDKLHDLAKATDDAEKAQDKLLAAYVRLSGTGQSSLSRMASEYRGDIADAHARGTATPQNLDLLNFGYRQGTAEEMNKPNAESNASMFSQRKWLNPDGSLHVEATLKDSKIDELIDQALTISNKFAREDYSEFQKAQRERVSEFGANAMGVGSGVYDPFSVIQPMRTRAQAATTFDQDQQHRIAMVGINGGDEQNSPITQALQVSQIEMETALQHRKDAEAEINATLAGQKNQEARDQALFNTRVKYEDDIHSIQLKNEEEIAEYRKKLEDEQHHAFATGIVGLFHAGLTGHGTDFLKTMGVNMGDKVLENAAMGFAKTDAYKGVSDSLHIFSDPNSLMGSLFSGTMFGPNPLKIPAVTGAATGTNDPDAMIGRILQGKSTGSNPLSGTNNPLTTSINSNVTALTSNTQAIADLYAALTGNSIPGIASDGTQNNMPITGGLLGSGGGLFGGGSMGSGVYSLFGDIPNITSTTGQSGSPALASIISTLGLGGGGGVPGLSPAGIRASSAVGASTMGFSGFMSGVSGGPNIEGALTGVEQLPGGGAQSITTAQQVGAGVATTAGIVGGVETAKAGFQQGGAGGVFKGVSGVATAAAAADPDPDSQAVLETVAEMTALVSKIFGDPRQERENTINKELGNDRYQQPDAINKTSTYGNMYSDYDQNGNLRTSSFAANPMQSQPFSWFSNGQFYNYPGVQISPFQNPDLVVPPNVAPVSSYNPEGIGPGGGRVYSPSGSTVPNGSGAGPSHTIVFNVGAMDASTFEDFVGSAAVQMHITNAVAKGIQGGNGSALVRQMNSSLGASR